MASRGRHRHHIKEEQAPVLECHPSTDLALTGEEVPDPAMTPVDLATDAEEYAQVSSCARTLTPLLDLCVWWAAALLICLVMEEL